MGPRKKVNGGSSTPTPSQESNPSKTGQLGQELIKFFEGCRLESYLCPSHIWTIGYGSTGPEIVEGLHITQAVANQMLRDDLDRFERAVIENIDVALDQCEFDALVSFAFNTGAGALQESTLRKRLNRGEDKPTVFSEELKRWVNGPNGPLEGLVRRREAETKLANQKQFP